MLVEFNLLISMIDSKFQSGILDDAINQLKRPIKAYCSTKDLSGHGQLDGRRVLYGPHPPYQDAC